MDSYVMDQIKNWTIGIITGLSLVLFSVMPVQLFMVMQGSVTEKLPVTPADFTPAVRIIAFTDSHNKNDHVADAVDTAYELFDNDETYKGVDAFFGLGDFSSVGAEGDYINYVNTLKEHVREETVCINIHGNHEFKDGNYREYFIKNFGYEPDTVTEINGFSCIAFSGERGATEWTYTSSSLKWLDKAIGDAQNKAAGKAVFVFQHPHPWGTVYGSSVWCDPELNPVFNKHPGIVDFSGHSHFPMNDPRSMLQTTYTTVGCGAMATFELDKNCIPGQHPDGYDPAAEMCVIEADNDGSVRIRGYDLLSDTYFCDYYIDDVNNRDTYAYNYKNMKAHDAAPVFPDDVKAGAYKNDNGEWVVSFDEAQVPEGFIVHNYKVTVKDSGGKSVVNDTFINDYYVIDEDDTFEIRLGADALEAGKEYTLTAKAESAYKYHSDTIKLKFTAG